MIHESTKDKVAVDSVDLKYFMKVLREQRAENNFQSLRILGDLITDSETWFSDDKVYWVRRAL
jgi:hypothetical protein